jgi:serine/threonine-protein kinase
MRLGPYEITAALGAGGMGEVYRARDTRLNRAVAVKVLGESLAADPQFRERFDREARTISQLDHPHICAVYDVGEQDGMAYLVMQYLEGETLASRLARGSARGLPLDDALRVAVEIASALDGAHRAGVVHRDLKPGNVMLTSGGAKLLDFGLAKSQTAVIAGAGQSMLPTTPPDLTAQGAILGTLQYMSPEQLEGGSVDARTDIFAFGALLYEMCTGRRPFEAKSTAGLIAAILERDAAPVSSLQPLAPASLDRVVATCLTKSPDDRWQTARDLLRELKWLADGRDAQPLGGSARHRVAWTVAVVCAIVAVVAAVVAVWGWRRVTPSSEASAARVDVAAPSGVRFANDVLPILALSPRGTDLVYVGEREGVTQLYVRRLDAFETKPIPGTEGAIGPFFSPDGQWVGFSADGKLKKVSLSGGVPVTLADAGGGFFGGTWGSDGTIVFAPTDVGFARVSSNGGDARSLTTLDATKKDGGHLWPSFLPDGKSVLMTVGTVGTSLERASIDLLSLESGRRTTLIPGGTYARYVPSGHIVYGTSGTIMAVPFDVATLTVTGQAVPMVDGVVQSQMGAVQFSVSDTGTLAYVAGALRTPRRSLVWMDRTGISTPLPLPRRPYVGPRLSPDGRTIAFGIQGATHDVWISAVERDTLTRLTFGADGYWPMWTPDGTRVVFQSNPDGPWNMYSTPVDRSVAPERLLRSDRTQVALSISPDGQALAFTEIHPTTAEDIWIFSFTQRKARPFAVTAASEFSPSIAPDGRWLAYHSNETGRDEVYVQRFPDGGQKEQVTSGGGRYPRWRRDGRELFFLNEGRMMTMDVEGTTGFTHTQPRELFTVKGIVIPTVPYDVTADGQRFVFALEDDPGPGPTHVNLAQGWFAELIRRSPRR